MALAAPANGVYQIANWNVSTLCLGTRVNGSDIDILTMSCAQAENQQWEFTSQSESNAYIIRNLATQTYPAWNGSLADCACSGDNMSSFDTPRQTWYLKQTSEGYQIAPTAAFNLTWNIRGGVNNNSALILWPPAQGVQRNDRWRFERVVKPVSTAKIVGASVGGAVGGIALLVLLWLQAHNLHYILSALAFALFGWALFGRRVLRFTVDKDVGPIEISLFLSPNEVIKDSESLLVWDVEKIGHSRRSFTTICPVMSGTSDGQTQIGFATVKHKNVDGVDCFKPENCAPAPAKWDGDKFEKLDNEGDNKHTLQIDPETVGVGFAVGTYDSKKDTIKPYYHIGDSEGSNGHEANTNLYLHVFLTHGYHIGQYGENLVQRLENDSLLPDGKGYKVLDLKPVSHWHISKVNGKIQMSVKGQAKRSTVWQAV